MESKNNKTPYKQSPLHIKKQLLFSISKSVRVLSPLADGGSGCGRAGEVTRSSDQLRNLERHLLEEKEKIAFTATNGALEKYGHRKLLIRFC